MSVFIPFRNVATVTPIANALLDINAMAESPLILLFSLILNNKNAEMTTTGMATGNGVRLNADAIANAPNPTWESPSPIMEYLFNTRLTPNNDAQSETGIPMINALIIKVCSNIDKISMMIYSLSVMVSIGECVLACAFHSHHNDSYDKENDCQVHCADILVSCRKKFHR